MDINEIKTEIQTVFNRTLEESMKDPSGRPTGYALASAIVSDEVLNNKEQLSCVLENMGKVLAETVLEKKLVVLSDLIVEVETNRGINFNDEDFPEINKVIVAKYFVKQLVGESQRQ